MKILLIDGGPYFGGQARHVYDLARGLCARGHRVSVAFRHPQLGEALQSVEVACYRLPFRAGVDILSLRSLHSIIRKNGFDVVHTHGVRAGVIGRAAAKLDGHPKVVHTVHALASDLVRGKGPLAALRRAVYSRTDAKLALLTDKLITVSDDLRRQSVNGGIAGDKVITIHSGVDLSQYEVLEDKTHARGRIGVPTGCKLVGTVARFTLQKNLSDFLRAAKTVSRQFEDVMFVLIGDGPEAAVLREQAYLLGISHRTIFAGLRKDVAKILPAFDVFVLSSLWEGHPLSVLEAMAAGLPVVATRVTGIAETVLDGQTGHTAEPGDVQGLADGIARILSDPEKANVMGEAARRRAIDRFGLDRMVREVEQVYFSLAEPGMYREIARVF